MGALDDVSARLRRVDWTKMSEHRFSRVALMKEFLRRSALWSEALGCPESWPFFDITGAANPSAPAPEVPEDLLRPKLPMRIEYSIYAMLRFAMQPVEIAGLPHPYEPLLIFYERGGLFSVENRMVDVDSVGIHIHERAKYLVATPFVAAFDERTLNELDRDPRTKSASTSTSSSTAAARATEKNTAPRGVPVTWAELLDPARKLAQAFDETLELLREQAAIVGREELMGLFHTAGESLCGLAVVGGPESCLPTLSEVGDYFPQAVEGLGKRPGSHAVVEADGFLKYATASLCCGGPALPSLLDEGEWIDAVASSSSTLKNLEQLTLLSVAIRQTERVSKLLGRQPMAFKPGENFGFDVPSFTLYLAAAVDASAGLDAVAPAWEAFVRGFPRKRAAKTLNWGNLLAAARAVYAVIGGQPIENTAASLHSYVKKLAAEPAT